MFSGSDDKTVKHWDLSTKTLLNHYKCFSDYVRTLDTTPISPSLLLAGSYDNTCALIDTRIKEPVFIINHDNPIESVLFHPSGNSIFTAGGNVIKVWDISSHNLINVFSGHQKTITSLGLDSSKNRIVSSSLDGHIKIYDLKTYEITHGYKFNSPVLSFSLSSDGHYFCVGMSNSKFIIKERQKETKEDDEEESDVDDLFKTNEPPPLTGIARFLRGPEVKPEPTDQVIYQTRRGGMFKWDKHLKQFEYHKALDSVLQSRRTPSIIAVLEELQRRSIMLIYLDGLKIALQSRDENTIQPILLFIIHYIINPLYTPLLVYCSQIILDLYAPILGQGSSIDDLIINLKKKILHECKFEDKVFFYLIFRLMK